MARVLFVRVSVQTYDEDQVKKNWPHLFRLVLPEGESSMKGSERGVFALTAALRDSVQFSLIPTEQKEILRPFAARLSAIEHQLEDVLGNQNVVEARKCADAIEDCLDEAEEALR